MDKSIKELELDKSLSIDLADVIEEHKVTAEQAGAALLSLLAFTMERAYMTEASVIYGENTVKQLRVFITEVGEGMPKEETLQ